MNRLGAIEILETMAMAESTFPDEESKKCCEAIDLAVEALKREGASFDEPLTLEQLWEMDGKPVWVEYSCDFPANQWRVIKFHEDGKILAFTDERYEIMKTYGEVWFAYTYPPANIDREAWEPCEWCGEWLGGDCRPREQDAGYKLYAGYCKQVAADDFYEDETEELNYCPICGRPFTQKAWAELEKRLRG